MTTQMTRRYIRLTRRVGGEVATTRTADHIAVVIGMTETSIACQVDCHRILGRIQEASVRTGDPRQRGENVPSNEPPSEAPSESALDLSEIEEAAEIAVDIERVIVTNRSLDTTTRIGARRENPGPHAQDPQSNAAEHHLFDRRVF